MAKTHRMTLLAMVLLGLSRVDARAQASPAAAPLGFINVNVGAQPQRRSIEKTDRLPVFGETATISSSQAIQNGPIFDVTGGYRVWRGLALAVGFSSFSKASDGAVVATIPSPVFFDQPSTVTKTQTGLGHTERGVHVQAVWFIPATSKIDVAVSVGPSFIHVTQELVSGAALSPGSQDISLTLGSEEGTALGVNAGIDGTYLFTRNIGAGLFIRYAGGTLDLPSAPALKVGGFQAGIGARIRF